MFSRAAQSLIDHAKDIAAARRDSELSLDVLVASAASDHGARQMLAQGLRREPAEVARQFEAPDQSRRWPGAIPVSTEVRETVAFAKALVPRYPLAEHPTLIDATHLVCALCRAVLMRDSRGIDTRDEDRLRALLERWINRAAEPASLGDLANRARDVRRELLARLHGQDAAVHQFVEGLFGTEVVADVDGERRRPCGLFVFAGPPSRVS